MLLDFLDEAEPPKPPKSVAVCVRLPKGLSDDIADMAKQLGLTRSVLVIRVLEAARNEFQARLGAGGSHDIHGE